MVSLLVLLILISIETNFACVVKETCCHGKESEHLSNCMKLIDPKKHKEPSTAIKICTKDERCYWSCDLVGNIYESAQESIVFGVPTFVKADKLTKEGFPIIGALQGYARTADFSTVASYFYSEEDFQDTQALNEEGHDGVFHVDECGALYFLPYKIKPTIDDVQFKISKIHLRPVSKIAKYFKYNVPEIESKPLIPSEPQKIPIDLFQKEHKKDGRKRVEVERNEPDFTLSAVHSVGMLATFVLDPEDHKKSRWFSSCSGTLLTPKHVFTAAHCTVGPDHNAIKDWNGQFRVQRFYDSINGAVPYTEDGDYGTYLYNLPREQLHYYEIRDVYVPKGYFYGKTLKQKQRYASFVYTGYSPNSEHDWAIYRLKSPDHSGKIIKFGYYSVKGIFTDHLLDEETFYTAGYPGDKPVGELYMSVVDLDTSDQNEVDVGDMYPSLFDHGHYYTKGQSGSSVFIHKHKQPSIVIGSVSGAAESGEDAEDYELGHYQKDAHDEVFHGDERIRFIDKQSFEEICGILEKDGFLNCDIRGRGL